MRIQTATTQDLLTDPAAVIASAGPDLAREVLIGVRQEAYAQIEQLVAFEDDLTLHHIAARSGRYYTRWPVESAPKASASDWRRGTAAEFRNGLAHPALCGT